MTLAEFYTLFARWEADLRRAHQAHPDLLQAAEEQAHSPEEILLFQGHWELGALLAGLLRLRPLLFLLGPPGGAFSAARENQITDRLRAMGHDTVTPDLVADFFHAWREVHTTLAPFGSLGKEDDPDVIPVPRL